MGRGANRGLGIDFTFPLQKGFVNNRGETLIHEVGLRCVCNQEDMHAGMVQHDGKVLRRRSKFRCDVCGGEGYIYRQPRKIVALVTSVRQQMSQLDAGWAMPGDAIVSVKPDVVISGGDLLTFTWPEVVPDGQVIVRGAAQISDNLTRKFQLDPDEDRLLYNAVDSVHCEDEDGIVYNAGADFILNGSKIIKWVGNKPHKKKVYTLKYTAYLEWVAWFPPDIRRDRDRDLGYRVAIRKRHVALANEDPSGTPSDKMPFCDRLKVCS